MKEKIDLLEENRQVVDMLKKANMRLDKQLALSEFRKKILFKNLNSIEDSQLRAFIKVKQKTLLKY